MKRIGALAIAACLALPLTACTDGDSPATAPTVSPTAAEAEHVRTLEIYSAVIRQILTKDDAYGSSKSRPTPYRRVAVVEAPLVVEAVVVAGGIPRQPRSFAEAFSAEFRADLRKALADLTPLRFVSAADGAAVDNERLFRGPGAVVTLGQIVEAGSQVHVSHELRCALRCGQFMTYVLERRGDSWVVTGNVGVSTIS